MRYLKYVVGLAVLWLAAASPLVAKTRKALSHPAKSSHAGSKPAASGKRAGASASNRKSVTVGRSTKLSARGKGKKGKRGAVVARSGPPRQQSPTSERYSQIQQALSDKGYYKGTVDGTWNSETVDALKRFQADQKLQADGKINSLTLIGLGLGPKYDTLPDFAARPASEPAVSPQ